MIWVRSRNFVENMWTPIIPTSVISIYTPGDEPAQLPDSELVMSVHRSSFYDVGSDVIGYPSISSEQADDIVQFVLETSESNCLLVHCDAGISRSAGVAAAISKVMHGDDSFFYINYIPNRYVERMVLEAFERKVKEIDESIRNRR